MRKTFLALTLIWLIGSCHLNANDCSPWGIERAFPVSDAVFIGRIEKVGQPKTANRDHLSRSIHFKVIKYFKGQIGKKVTVWTLPDWEWSEYTEFPTGRFALTEPRHPYPPETEFLIFADYNKLQLEGRPKRRVLTVSMCSRSGLLKDKTEDVRFIEARIARKRSNQARKVKSR